MAENCKDIREKFKLEQASLKYKSEMVDTLKAELTENKNNVEALDVNNELLRKEIAVKNSENEKLYVVVDSLKNDLSKTNEDNEK